MAIFMRLKVRYIKIADIQVRSTHTPTHTQLTVTECIDVTKQTVASASGGRGEKAGQARLWATGKRGLCFR